MIELNKDYQKTVNLMTYLSQEWGIEKCNFFIYPDEKKSFSCSWPFAS